MRRPCTRNSSIGLVRLPHREGHKDNIRSTEGSYILVPRPNIIGGYQKSWFVGSLWYYTIYDLPCTIYHISYIPCIIYHILYIVYMLSYHIPTWSLGPLTVAVVLGPGMAEAASPSCRDLLRALQAGLLGYHTEEKLLSGAFLETSLLW